MNFAPDLYAGTAEFYARYRVPYPQPMIDDLRERAGLSGSARLLDLACGPGKVALQFAPYVGEILAVDQEPDMIAKGRELAESLGVGKIRWRVGRAEDLALPAGSLTMVTIGNAYHRLDRPRVAELVKGWLAPGGVLALLWSNGFSKGDEPWKQVVRDLVDKWIGPPLSPAAEASYASVEILHAAGFAEVGERQFELPWTWTADSIIGWLYSTSYASKTALGDRADGFEAALRRALADHDAGGEYRETISCAYTFGRAPVPA